MAESPKQKGLIWVGSDDGLVHVTSDAGKTWTNVTEQLPGLPEWATIKMIEPSPFEAAVAYVVVDGHMIDDTAPVPLPHRRSRQDLVAALRERCPRTFRCTSCAKTPEARAMLYAGTERGVVFSADAGKTWRAAPAQPAHRPGSRPGRQERRPRRGHPRPVALDLRRPDADPSLRTQIAEQAAGRACRPVRPPAGGIMDGGRHGPRRQPARRGDPHFWLKDKPKAAARRSRSWTPRASSCARWQGDRPRADRRAKGRGRRQGTDRSRSRRPRRRKQEEEQPESRPRASPRKPRMPDDAGPAPHGLEPGATTRPGRSRKPGSIPATAEAGPLALPGKYTVRLTVDGQTATAPLEILPDPRVRSPPPTCKNRFAWRSPYAMISTDSPRGRAAPDGPHAAPGPQRPDPRHRPGEALAKSLAGLLPKLDALEAKLHNPKAQVTYDILAMKGGAQLYSNLGWLYGSVLEGDGPPTKGMREAAARPGAEADQLRLTFRSLIDKDLAELNRQAEKRWT